MYASSSQIHVYQRFSIYNQEWNCEKTTSNCVFKPEKDRWRKLKVECSKTDSEERKFTFKEDRKLVEML